MKPLWIDGYNLLFAMKRGGFSKKDQVIALLDHLFASKKLSASILFDRDHKGILLPYKQSRLLEAITIVYPPQGLSADAYFIEMASFYPIKVVTNDKELSRLLENLGSEVEAVDSFLKKIFKKRVGETTVKPVEPSDRELLEFTKIFEDRYEKNSDF